MLHNYTAYKAAFHSGKDGAGNWEKYKTTLSRFLRSRSLAANTGVARNLWLVGVLAWAVLFTGKVV